LFKPEKVGFDNPLKDGKKPSRKRTGSRNPSGRHCRTFAGISPALLCISVQLATGVTDKS
jgi:hypothetical protein